MAVSESSSSCVKNMRTKSSRAHLTNTQRTIMQSLLSAFHVNNGNWATETNLLEGGRYAMAHSEHIIKYMPVRAVAKLCSVRGDLTTVRSASIFLRQLLRWKGKKLEVKRENNKLKWRIA